MVSKVQISRLLIGAVIFSAVQCAGLIAVQLAATGPVQAQVRDDRYPFLHRQRSGGGGFFGDLFGNPGTYRRYQQYEQPYEQRQSTEHAHAPAPRKVNKDVTPTTTIVVLGDEMADWLGYGLEEAFSDQPEVAINRQNKPRSGLLRYDAKGDLDWWHVARDILTKEKANYVVMMLGVSDRDNIREKDLAKEAEKQKAENQQSVEKKGEKGDGKTTNDKDKQGDNQKIAAPESKKPNGVIEFRSDQWVAVYSKRIDETIVALKSKGVPVFWVGLPSIRGTKSTADTVYLNDLYRQRAERAGIVYIDIWDGFVDDTGKYTTFGPDYEGQMRRLRSADGVYFTQSGARKLAHYVEREIRRYMSNRVPVALPAGPVAVPPSAGKSTARPVAGPVVPLTVMTGTGDQLLGAAGTRPIYGDATAVDVLVKGEPVNAPRGRADDFNWQNGESNGALPASQSSGPATTAPPALARTEPAPKIRQVEPPSGNTTEIKSATPPAPAPAANTKPVPPANVAANPPLHHNPTPPRRRTNFPFNPFGWLR